MRRRKTQQTEKRIRHLERTVTKHGQELQQVAKRVEECESLLATLTKQMKAELEAFGDYKNRTQSELKNITRHLRRSDAVLTALVTTAENEADAARARQLRKRVRNNLTRAENTLTQRKKAA